MKVGHTLLPGAKECIGFLRRNGILFSIISNNSTKSRHEYRDFFRKFGVEVNLDEIFTPNVIAKYYLYERFGDQPVLLIGSDSIFDELDNINLHNTDSSMEKFACVYIGLDLEINYKKLQRAAYALQDGAYLVSANPDVTYPLEDGYRIPGNGAFLELLRHFTDKEVVVLGKPERHMVDLIKRETGSKDEDLLMVGDRLETDMLFGNRCGIHTAFVRTGIDKDVETKGLPQELTPTYDLRDLDELVSLLRKQRNG